MQLYFVKCSFIKPLVKGSGNARKPLEFFDTDINRYAALNHIPAIAHPGLLSSRMYCCWYFSDVWTDVPHIIVWRFQHVHDLKRKVSCLITQSFRCEKNDMVGRIIDLIVWNINNIAAPNESHEVCQCVSVYVYGAWCHQLSSALRVKSDQVIFQNNCNAQLTVTQYTHDAQHSLMLVKCWASVARCHLTNKMSLSKTSTNIIG